MRYVITGGAGFIGSNFSRMLLTGALNLEIPIEVIVVDKLTYAGKLSNLDPVMNDKRFKFVLGDICDANLMGEVLAGCDVLINFAAESHVDRSIESATDFVTSNIVGVSVLLDQGLKQNVKVFLQVSTDEVYGSIRDGSWDEESPLEPNSPYAASKASADLLVRSFFVTHGLDTRITRCSNNYGPNQFPEKIIPLFVKNLMQGKKIPLYGTGQNIREWIHVDDHCRGIALAITNGTAGNVYHLSGGHELTNTELAHAILKYFELDENAIQQVEDRKGHDFRYSLDGKKTATLLGYSPQVTFDKGLSDTINWYKNNPDW